MNKRFWMFGLLATPMMYRMAETEGGAAVTNPAPAAAAAPDPAVAPAPAAAADPATAAAPASAAAPWHKSGDFTADEQQWLAAKGLAVEDSKDILAKLVRGHRSAEQRIGKGLDSILDKPAKGQAHAEWARANAAALGLPDKEDGYAVEPPDFWPKDAPWDSELEGKARKLAFDMGVSPETHKAYVGLFAEKMKALDESSALELEGAKGKMMADLQKDFGAQTDAKITQARQAAQMVAEKAGLDAEAVERIGKLLAKDTGDAQVIRFMATIAEMAGEDSMVQPNGGGSLTMTPVDARAAYEKFVGPEGDYGKAFAAGDTMTMQKLAARRTELAKLASA